MKVIYDFIYTVKKNGGIGLRLSGQVGKASIID